jgi:hypothetical protein
MDNPYISTTALSEIAGDMSNLAYRMEILAEDVNEAPGALCTRAQIEANRVSSFPDLARVVVGVDPTANILDIRGENNTFDGTIVLGARGTIQHRDGGQTILSIANDYNSDSAKIEFRMKGNTSSDSKLTILGSGVATFSNTINVKGDINIGDYTTNTTLTFQSVNNGASRINFYDANNTEGVYIRNTGIPYGGDLRFGARWDDDEDKVFFNLRQSSAGASYDVRFGLNVNPDETFHVSSNGITASAPSKGWPVYDAELDTNARRFIFQTAGNGGVSTAGQGASTALILGQYFDSRVIITTPGAGSATPSDQGVGRGRDMMIKAGASDNTVGYVGGRLYLNGGIGFLDGLRLGVILQNRGQKLTTRTENSLSATIIFTNFR